MPPSTAETLYSDPRCLKKKAELEVLAEGLKAANIPLVHWDEADGPTECIFVQGQDFKAYLWEAFMPNAAYADWLLEADMASAYAYERSVLQLLQSRAPGCWSLKMPSHAVHIERCSTSFPMRALVWAHRDPFKSHRVVPPPELPVARRARSRRLRLLCRTCYVTPCARRTADAHQEAHRRRPVFRPALRGLMRDPVGVMRSLYDWAGDELTPSTEQAILAGSNGMQAVRGTALFARGLWRHPRRPRAHLRRVPLDVRRGTGERVKIAVTNEQHGFDVVEVPDAAPRGENSSSGSPPAVSADRTSKRSPTCRRHGDGPRTRR